MGVKGLSTLIHKVVSPQRIDFISAALQAANKCLARLRKFAQDAKTKQKLRDAHAVTASYGSVRDLLAALDHLEVLIDSNCFFGTHIRSLQECGMYAPGATRVYLQTIEKLGSLTAPCYLIRVTTTTRSVATESRPCASPEAAGAEEPVTTITTTYHHAVGTAGSVPVVDPESVSASVSADAPAPFARTVIRTLGGGRETVTTVEDRLSTRFLTVPVVRLHSSWDGVSEPIKASTTIERRAASMAEVAVARVHAPDDSVPAANAAAFAISLALRSPGARSRGGKSNGSNSSPFVATRASPDVANLGKTLNGATMDAFAALGAVQYNADTENDVQVLWLARRLRAYAIITNDSDFFLCPDLSDVYVVNINSMASAPAATPRSAKELYGPPALTVAAPAGAAPATAYALTAPGPRGRSGSISAAVPGCGSACGVASLAGCSCCGSDLNVQFSLPSADDVEAAFEADAAAEYRALPSVRLPASAPASTPEEAVTVAACTRDALDSCPYNPSPLLFAPGRDRLIAAAAAAAAATGAVAAAPVSIALGSSPTSAQPCPTVRAYVCVLTPADVEAHWRLHAASATAPAAAAPAREVSWDACAAVGTVLRPVTTEAMAAASHSAPNRVALAAAVAAAANKATAAGTAVPARVTVPLAALGAYAPALARFHSPEHAHLTALAHTYSSICGAINTRARMMFRAAEMRQCHLPLVGLLVGNDMFSVPAFRDALARNSEALQLFTEYVYGATCLCTIPAMLIPPTR
jgi:hypothetical protein